MTSFNVVGSIHIEQFTTRLCAHATRPELKEWLARVIPKHIKRTGSVLTRIRSEAALIEQFAKNKDRALVGKLRGILAAGEPLHRFDPTSDAAFELHDDVRSVIDWLDSIPEHDRHLRRINRMSYLDAHALSVAWHDKLLKLSADADDPDVVEEIEVIATLEDGSRFVELKGPVALLREGNLMGHCVGGRGYVVAVASGATRIVSLRDAENRPHATLEIGRSYRTRAITAIQIKGKGNKPPVEKWAAMVRPFVKQHGLAAERDGEAIGLITLNGRTFDHPDEVVDHFADSIAPKATLKASTLEAMMPRNVLNMIRMRHAELRPNGRRRLLNAIEESSAPIKTTATVLVEGPQGLRMDRIVHTVPVGIVEALQTDLLSGVEGEAVARIGILVDDLLERIRIAPGHIHQIEFAGGIQGKNALLDQLAAFSGRSKSLAEVRAFADEERRRNHANLVASIRKQTSGHSRNRAEQSWAQETSQLQRTSKDAIEKDRQSYSMGAII